jgi:hypothetical protein
LQTQDSRISEQELAQKIFHLHDDLCMGFRRTNKEFTRLKQAETRQLQRLELKREKAEILKRRNMLFVEEHTMSFEQRKQLFSDQDKLLRFAKRVMPTIDPMLWEEFSQFCIERGYDLANATAIALGNQKDFESQQVFSGLGKFDEYLRRRIVEYLADLCEQERREGENGQTNESESGSNEGEIEIVTIELPDNFSWQ